MNTNCGIQIRHNWNARGKTHRHKLAAVAEGPYCVFDKTDNTVAIKIRSKESISQSRIASVPAPKVVD